MSSNYDEYYLEFKAFSYLETVDQFNSFRFYISMTFL